MAFSFGELKSGNPALRKAFSRPHAAYGSDVMTVSGTVNKTGVLFLLLIAGGYFGWGPSGAPLMFLCLIVGFILALVISFKQNLAPALSPIYAIAEGVVLGSISSIAERAYPGIAMNAFLLTLSTMGLMLALYHFKVIRATPLFQKVVFFATGAIMMTYLVDMVMGMFGHSVPYLNSASPIGIAISVGIVIVAALNLIMDFEVIHRGAQMGAPKYMEWYGGFALIVTLVWLYLEILNLLSKLSSQQR